VGTSFSRALSSCFRGKIRGRARVRARARVRVRVSLELLHAGVVLGGDELREGVRA
jgi:hypothetical protein